MGASTSGAGVDGVLFGGVGPAGAPWVGLTAVDDGAGTRRRRVAVAGVSLMGAAALSTAVFQTVAGTSTSLAMTPGLGALFAGSSTPTPQGPTSPGPALGPTALAAPAITDLGPVPGVAPPTSATQVDLQAQRGPLPVAAGPADGGGTGSPAAGAPVGPGTGGSAPGGAAPGGSAPGGSTTTRPTTTTPTSASPTTTTRRTPPSTTQPPTTRRSTTAPSGSTTRPSRTSSAPSSRPSDPSVSKPSPSSGSSRPAGRSSGSDKPSSGGSGF